MTEKKNSLRDRGHLMYALESFLPLNRVKKEKNIILFAKFLQKVTAI